MWTLLQTVVVEDSGFNEIWAGIFTLIGAIIGVGGVILSTRLISQHERSLERESERRRWRLEQLQPVLTRARQSTADFAIWDQEHYSVFHTGTEQELDGFTRHVKTVTHPLRDLGYIIVMGRSVEGELPERMTDFYKAYTDCVHFIIARLDYNLAARRLGLRWRSIYPPSKMLDPMMDLIVNLLHETEKYAFGESDHLTSRELQAMLAAYDQAKSERSPLPDKD